MCKVFIEKENKIVEAKENKTLMDVLLDENIFVDNACNGKGVCGKCKIKLISGDLGELSETEKKLLSQKEINDNIRLSCLVKPKEDIKIELLQKERKHRVLSSGYMPKFQVNPSIHKKLISLEKSTLENQRPLEDEILRQLNTDKLDWKLLKEIKPQDEKITAVFNNDEVIYLEKNDTRDKIYGVIMDIGTTTVVTSLVDINSGEELCVESMINSQKQYGLDVLTRITYEVENQEDGVENLQKAIVTSINEMIEKLCKKANVNKKHIYEITVAANCTMMHMLLGIDAKSIGKSPFAPIFTTSKNILAKDIGLSACEKARLYCLPSVSAYIGADIVAGAYVCELNKADENVLFIDIGTNGEIVLSNKGNLLSCSCAAGPALEGMNISCGMRAANGAIEDVVINEEETAITVIGEEKPIGICGSGILAVVKELLKTGIVRDNGAFIKLEKLEEDDYRLNKIQINNKKREFILYDDNKNKLLITQGDIRQVQLSKGAILSGFYALLKKANIEMKDLKKVMIAGQFGAHVSVDSLVGTGILPMEVKEKIVYVGNSSKTGAYMALMSKEAKKDMELLSKNMEYMELGASEGYERLFSSCLKFPSNQL
ncbi:MAG: ASKHA domain-containing protein [Terrisporobacter othiniensis]|uniref:ASKHA domain-containing protein n=1 Tax=Terrisporobacter petrolearius TaxID=1460447 RepID=UPI0022E46179|nr:ASKHA domain-containing protein [Terrisporobacter petrolearius]MDU4859860.1 ASKHA domain-containing protein [Terrisporobacter othiniensis]MDU6996442.1 ASKHA domain-containing protein [Terrisporobacter othiniensis]